MKLNSIKNVSDKRVLDFNKLGVYSVEDLIKFYPRYYLDMTKITPIKDAYHNDCVLTVAKVEIQPRVQSGGRVKYVKTYCSQNKDTFEIIWFNQPYVANKLKCGEEYFFYGRVQNKFGIASMVNPVFEPVTTNNKLKALCPCIKRLAL